MYNFKTHIFIIALFLMAAFVYAQNPVYENMSDVSTLPDVEFYDIQEDDEHYIWFAADKGLFRYNGKSYQRYSHPNQKSNSLFQLKFDTENKLWCNNIYGQLFYVENDQLELFYDASDLVKGQLAAYTILEQHIRLFTTSGIYDIHKNTKKVTKVFDGWCISNANSKDSDYVFVLNKEGQFKKHRVYKIEGANASKLFEIKSLKLIQSPKLFAFKDEVFLTHKSDAGNILYVINKADDTVEKIKTPNALKSETIYNFINFGSDYWFLTTAGVFVFEFKEGHFNYKDRFFKSESITDVAIDFNQNYWFATLDNGVLVSPNLNIRQTNLDYIDAKVTAAIGLNQNKFVLGTNNGKLLFYNKNQLVKSIQLPGNKIIGKFFYDAMHEQLVVSINASESVIVNLNTDKITDVNNRFSVAKAFSKIDDNTMFYGNYRQGIVYKQPFNNPEKKVLKESRVKASEVLDDHLFVSYIDGFYKYNTNTFVSEELKFESNSLLVNAITKSNDILWLATQHNGLIKFENNRLSKSEIDLPNHLQINNIHCDGDVLWISTDAGLFQYQVTRKTLKLLSAQDGLNTAVNDFLILQDQIIVPLPKVFYTLPKTPDLFKTFKTSKIRVEAVSINDRDTLVASNYKLPHDFNKIGLTFNANGFQSNQHVNYQYRVKQIDSSWQTIPLNTHFVNFNSLSSGTYTFELKAKNISAKTPVFAAPITFEIAKPFWETYWFYGLVLLTVFGLIWLYFRWRLQQKEAQRIAEIDKILIDKKITNLRLENLRSQMNPHFIFNALNSIQDYIVSNEKELASSYLVKFSRLIRMYLDYSQQNEITLQEELNALKLYLELEKVRFEDELEYQIHIDHQLKTKQIKVPSLFIQPYVENALKHGLLHKTKDRQLKVEAKITENNNLQITVEDNGIGRAQSEKLKRPNQQHKPFATKANEERVHLYKNKLKRNITIAIEDLYNENQTASGTKVVITMPI
ncbi:histidine kinase [Winogradskyella psychrotolerans]|uniref:sensor histidine kinase n=1 Tax=Winogradskyella psychrotolerans TaxID=1344585 RepID=UPI001C0785AD|nr:histidine kinase [Winogradskyella psychrotolerans]MBU2920579.1 histidine kinase [Winogradskyella psychrotolerans]